MEINENNYSISNHAKQRYAERIMGKDTTIDVARYVTLNEEKIKTEINKLINYGSLIFTGRQQKEGKSKLIDVYLKDCWVVLADSKEKNVITLYKIDLGLDDEFNKAYISKMVDKLNTAMATFEETKAQVDCENNEFREIISEAETQIKEYKTIIKNLEDLCSGYKMIIDNNCVKTAQANKKIIDTLNTLIGKKEF